MAAKRKKKRSAPKARAKAIPKKRSNAPKAKARAVPKKRKKPTSKQRTPAERIKRLEKQIKADKAKLRRDAKRIKQLQQKIRTRELAKRKQKEFTPREMLKVIEGYKKVQEIRLAQLDREADPSELAEILSLNDAIAGLDLEPENTPTVMAEMISAWYDDNLEDRIYELSLEYDDWSEHDLYELWHGYEPD